MVALVTFGVYVFGHYHSGMGEDEARALTFATLVLANLGLILSNRSWTRTILATLTMKNTALWWVVGGAVVFLILVLSMPLLRGSL